MFDFAFIPDLLKVEPSHWIESFLLTMIWLQSRGLRKDVSSLRDTFSEAKLINEIRFRDIEKRLTKLDGGVENG